LEERTEAVPHSNDSNSDLVHYTKDEISRGPSVGTPGRGLP
jgi:hypothetical protein